MDRRQRDGQGDRQLQRQTSSVKWTTTDKETNSEGEGERTGEQRNFGRLSRLLLDKLEETRGGEVGWG